MAVGVELTGDARKERKAEPVRVRGPQPIAENLFNEMDLSHGDERTRLAALLVHSITTDFDALSGRLQLRVVGSEHMLRICLHRERQGACTCSRPLAGVVDGRDDLECFARV